MLLLAPGTGGLNRLTGPFSPNVLLYVGPVTNVQMYVPCVPRAFHVRSTYLDSLFPGSSTLQISALDTHLEPTKHICSLKLIFPQPGHIWLLGIWA